MAIIAFYFVILKNKSRCVKTPGAKRRFRLSGTVSEDPSVAGQRRQNNKVRQAEKSRVYVQDTGYEIRKKIKTIQPYGRENTSKSRQVKGT